MISVVIPTRSSAAGIGPALGALTPGLMAGVLREVILADAGGDEAILGVAEESGAVLRRGPEERGPRLAAAAAAAKGDWLLFLDPGAQLPRDWPDRKSVV